MRFTYTDFSNFLKDFSNTIKKKYEYIQDELSWFNTDNNIVLECEIPIVFEKIKEGLNLYKEYDISMREIIEFEIILSLISTNQYYCNLNSLNGIKNKVHIKAKNNILIAERNELNHSYISELEESKKINLSLDDLISLFENKTFSEIKKELSLTEDALVLHKTFSIEEVENLIEKNYKKLNMIVQSKNKNIKIYLKRNSEFLDIKINASLNIKKSIEQYWVNMYLKKDDEKNMHKIISKTMFLSHRIENIDMETSNLSYLLFICEDKDFHFFIQNYKDFKKHLPIQEYYNKDSTEVAIEKNIKSLKYLLEKNHRINNIPRVEVLAAHHCLNNRINKDVLLKRYEEYIVAILKDFQESKENKITNSFALINLLNHMSDVQYKDEIKNLFPELFNIDKNNNWIEIKSDNDFLKIKIKKEYLLVNGVSIDNMIKINFEDVMSNMKNNLFEDVGIKIKDGNYIILAEKSPALKLLSKKNENEICISLIEIMENIVKNVTVELDKLLNNENDILNEALEQFKNDLKEISMFVLLKNIKKENGAERKKAKL